MSSVKPFAIDKQVVWQSYLKMKANRGAAGVDKQSIADFEIDLKGSLYKRWKLTSSGSDFPPPVKQVEIAKASGLTRVLGIPSVGDRIALMVVNHDLEPQLELKFDQDPCRYRQNKSVKI